VGFRLRFAENILRYVGACLDAEPDAKSAHLLSGQRFQLSPHAWLQDRDEGGK